MDHALRSLGYLTRVRRLAFDPYFARVADSATRAQIGPTTWGADYPSTSTQTTDPRAPPSPTARRRHDGCLRRSPAIPVLNPLHTDLVSTRVRNDQYHPQWGLLLDQVSVR